MLNTLSETSRYDVGIWLFGGALSLLLALYPLSATLVSGTYLPADADSFYHAHRILDSIVAPGRMYQFDARIHAPEGSWITWPWAYDMLQAWIGHVAVFGFGVTQPLAVLAYVAPLWTLFNAFLLLGIASRLGLSVPLKVVVMLCYACSPLTQALHRVGMLDHHFVEYSFVLANVLLGLGWLQRPDKSSRGIALGAMLGLAPAFHNGLFILQLPLLVTLAISWLLGRRIPAAAAVTFTGSLLVSTLLFLLPSEPFRSGMFEFALQSWFHMYVAASTGLMACLFARFERSKGSAALLIAVSALLFFFILGQTVRAGTFLSGHLVNLSDIDEVKGVFTHIANGRFYLLTSTYSGLLWVAPISLALLVLRLRYASDDADLFFVATSMGGIALLVLQYRFENYGSFALYFPLCLVIQDATVRWPSMARQIIAGFAVSVAVLYVPAVFALTARFPIGGTGDYEMTRTIYPALAKACEQRSGIILADSADGHFITYHTRCSVIADTFIMTHQHEQKLLEVDNLLGSSLADVLKRAPELRYIYVRRNDSVFDSNCANVPCKENSGLRQELLFATAPSPSALRLIGEVLFQRDRDHTEPLARAFEVIKASDQQTP